MNVLLVMPTLQYSIGYPAVLSSSDFAVGFAYLAAALKRAGHKVIGLNPNNQPGFPSAPAMLNELLSRSLTDSSPDLIGLGGLCTDFKFISDALQIIRRDRPEIPVVLGGGIVTNDTEFIFNTLRPDFCIVGEGEGPLVHLATMLEQNERAFNQIPNLGYWQEGKAVFTAQREPEGTIDDIPFPDYTPFGITDMLDNHSLSARYLYRYTRPNPRPMTLLAARGCPFKCTFCVHHDGRKYRARSIDNIIEEIRYLYDNYHFNILVLLDELFAADKSRLRLFCEALLAAKRQWGWDFDWLFQSHASSGLDREVLSLAKEAGCYYFSYGLESASPTILDSMQKKIRPAQVEEAIKLSREVGIGFGGNFIFGDPAETTDTMVETLTFFQNNCQNIHVFLGDVQVYPGSKLFTDCLDRGIIEDRPSYYQNIGRLMYNMTAMPKETWLTCMDTVFSLTTFPFLPAVSPTNGNPDPHGPEGKAASQYGQVPWDLTYPCPHCSREINGRELIAARADADVIFVAGCPSCHLRFRVQIPAQVVMTASNSTTPPVTRRASPTESVQPEQRETTLSRKQRILFLNLEFPTWHEARSWSYAASLGFEEGFEANGIDFLTIPVLPQVAPSDPRSWLNQLERLCDGQTFDQIWVELVHSNLDDAILKRLATMAPVRLGIIGESLHYRPEVYTESPHLMQRHATVMHRLQYMTHALVADERDADDLNAKGTVKALLWLNCIPERFITENPGTPQSSVATFCGAVYGERGNWLGLPALQKLLVRQQPLEDQTDYPQMFDAIQAVSTSALQGGMIANRQSLEIYLEPLRQVRRECFRLWLDGLRHGSAVVNLPSFLQNYAGRVLEGMAAGRPVISWAIPDRPQVNALFTDGIEILLFPKDRPEALAEHIRRIQNDPAFVQELTANARQKVWRFHTTEKRVQQILHWVDTGVEPFFGNADHNDLESVVQRFIGQFRDGETSVPEPVSPQTGTDKDKERDNYYSQLFLQDPTWSSPHPNEDEQARWTKISRFIKLAQIAAKMKGQTIGSMIEVGCGRGWLSNLASQLAPCEGIDPVADVIAVARHHYPALRFRSGTMEEVLASPGFTPYDAVLCTEVIEHVPRPAQAGFVCTMARLIRPGGFVIITTPRAEAFDAWMAVTNNSRQPVDDWLSEDELSGHFATAGFTAIGSDRIHVSLRNFGYLLTPTTEQLASPEVLPLYQVAAFQLSAVQNDSETPP